MTVPTRTATPVTSAAYGFGEGLRWDGAGSLLWVDLMAGRLHRAPVDDLDAVETLVELDEPLGAFAPCTAGGWLLATGRGLSHLDDDGHVRRLVELEPDGNRMNDATCDLQGRFWTGTMAYDEHEGAGSLWRVDLDGSVTRARRDVTVGNGPAFSPDGRTLYLDDSGRALTLAYDLDEATGAISGERVLVQHERGAGDGLTVDERGDLWVALFAGWGVHHHDSTGRLLERIEVGAAQVSSCCLVEGRLVMTTTSFGQDEPDPDAGRLFAVEVDAVAPPVRPFRGRLPGA